MILWVFSNLGDSMILNYRIIISLDEDSYTKVGNSTMPSSCCQMYVALLECLCLYIYRGDEGMFRCGTEGHGLVGNIGHGWTVGLVDLRGLFQPWRFYDSVK